MEMPTCMVTVDDVYGKGWWEKHREPVERAWKVQFAPYTGSQQCLDKAGDLTRLWPHSKPALLVIGPARPTLMEMYGVDRVTIPTGWEWTGEARLAVDGESYALVNVGAWHGATVIPRLILRRTEPKVWFKAEGHERCPKPEDYVWTSSFGWRKAEAALDQYLCATRHEELTPAYTLTQSMVDEGRVR